MPKRQREVKTDATKPKAQKPDKEKVKIRDSNSKDVNTSLTKVVERFVDRAFDSIREFTEIPKAVMRQDDHVAKYLALWIAATGVITVVCAALMAVSMAAEWRKEGKVNYGPPILTIFVGSALMMMSGFVLIIRLGNSAQAQGLANGFVRIEQNRSRRMTRVKAEMSLTPDKRPGPKL